MLGREAIAHMADATKRNLWKENLDWAMARVYTLARVAVFHRAKEVMNSSACIATHFPGLSPTRAVATAQALSQWVPKAPRKAGLLMPAFAQIEYAPA